MEYDRDDGGLQLAETGAASRAQPGCLIVCNEAITCCPLPIYQPPRPSPGDNYADLNGA